MGRFVPVRLRLVEDTAQDHGTDQSAHQNDAVRDLQSDQEIDRHPVDDTTRSETRANQIINEHEREAGRGESGDHDAATGRIDANPRSD